MFFLLFEKKSLPLRSALEIFYVPFQFADHVSIVEPKEDIIPTTPYSEQKGGKLPDQAAAAAPVATTPQPPAVPVA